ncbi:UNKNOWN [Stylonychia lemnae]|uniref:Cyclic nucleotide-binding domain-containing protein n=1 Tax=Stylonychia lemnae TaxID=5949 RepID=A0A078B8D8_STYLE|nr:UNKNOWN [Stylonychia lemnae]|eukprot:CDW89823.1 UNKNOWN [Stylonychia lemnae]
MFFKTLLQEKGLYDLNRIYKCLYLEQFQTDDIVCNFGEKGEKFYIVLKGIVGVKVPTEIKTTCKNYFEIMKFLIRQKQNVTKLKDNHSRVVKKFIDSIGSEPLDKLEGLEQLISFIDKRRQVLEFERQLQQIEDNASNNDSFVIPTTDIKKKKQAQIDQSQKEQFINEFQKQILIQKDTTKTISFSIQLIVLTEVAQLEEGKSFGELALITDQNRKATVYCKTNNVALAVLMKGDYQRYIGDSFKQKMDDAIKVLKNYDIFKKVSMRRLFTLYYYAKEKHYSKQCYLYRQDDKIDGVYLIVNGSYEKQRRNELVYKKSASPIRENGFDPNQLVLSLISGFEILGLEEIILGYKQRQHSVQVASEKAFVMFFSEKDFKERIIKPHPAILKHLRQQYAMKLQFYSKRENEINQLRFLMGKEQIKIMDALKLQSKRTSLGLRSCSVDRAKFIDQREQLQLLIKDQRMRGLYNRGGLTEFSNLMIQKSLNIDMMHLMEQDMLKKQQQSEFFKSRNNRTVLSKSQNNIKAMGLNDPRKDSLNMSKTLYSNINETTHASFLIDEKEKPDPKTSLSTRGKQSESIILKKFALKQNTTNEINIQTLEKVTARLQNQITQQCEALRQDREKKQLIQFLRNNGHNIGQQIAEQSIKRIQDDTDDQIDQNLVTYEEIERKRMIQSLRIKYGQSPLQSRHEESISFRGPKKKTLVINNAIKSFDKKTQERYLNGPLLQEDSIQLVELQSKYAIGTQRQDNIHSEQKTKSRNNFIDKLNSKASLQHDTMGSSKDYFIRLDRDQATFKKINDQKTVDNINKTPKLISQNSLYKQPDPIVFQQIQPKLLSIVLPNNIQHFQNQNQQTISNNQYLEYAKQNISVTQEDNLLKPNESFSRKKLKGSKMNSHHKSSNLNTDLPSTIQSEEHTPRLQKPLNKIKINRKNPAQRQMSSSIDVHANNHVFQGFADQSGDKFLFRFKSHIKIQTPTLNFNNNQNTRNNISQFSKFQDSFSFRQNRQSISPVLNQKIYEKIYQFKNFNPMKKLKKATNEPNFNRL